MEFLKLVIGKLNGDKEGKISMGKVKYLLRIWMKILEGSTPSFTKP